MRYLGVLVLCFFVRDAHGQADIRLPPSIIRGPPKDSIFRSDDQVILECQGEGTPAVVYEWKKNGRDLNLNLPNIQKGEHGTVTINQTTAMDEGFYQCFAENQYGTALSVKAHLQRALLESSSATSVLTKTVKEGEPFHIQAVTLKSFPKITYGWEIATSTIDKSPTALTLSRRIQIAENGDLHFAYAVPEDNLGGKLYKGTIHNPHLDVKAGGIYTNITVQRASRTSFRPSLAFSSDESQTVAIVGKSVSLRCFFYGNPEPTLSWKGPGNTLPIGRYRLDKFNSEFNITEIKSADQGDYVCTAQNTQERNEHTLQLRVEAIPTFRSATDGPFNVNITEGESIIFKCSAYARPEATITWLQNGKPLDVNNPPKRFQFSDNKTSLTIRDVCKDCPDRDSGTDLTVIQCNASNVHGYAFASGYLNVLTKTKVAPSDATEAKVKLNEERKVEFDCTATADPSTPPTVRWYKVEGEDLQRVYETLPYVSLKNGTLILQIPPNATYSWSHLVGEYQCIASNGYSKDVRRVKLEVENPPPKTPEVADFWWIYLTVAVFVLVFALMSISLGLLCGKKRRDNSERILMLPSSGNK